MRHEPRSILDLTPEEKERIHLMELVQRYLRACRRRGKNSETTAKKQIAAALGLGSDAAMSRFVRGKKPVSEAQIVSCLRLIGLSHVQFRKSLERCPLAIQIGKGSATMNPPVPGAWAGVRILRPNMQILAQRLVAYQVSIAPGKESGDETHIDSQPERDLIPYGDEAIILASGRARVEVGRKRFDLIHAGDAILLKSNCPHRARWLSPSGKTGQLGLSVTRQPISTVLTIIRYPLVSEA